jgi:hypothetical protein
MDKNIEYDISIISFFDILGFGKYVQKTENPKEIYDLLEILKYNAKPDEELAKMYDQRYVNFSDTFVRTTNILSETNQKFQVGILFHELLDLLHIQIGLISKKIFARGSVTIGKVYLKEGIIFGPGLNRAYELEKDLAIFPRIIIDPDVFYLLEEVPLIKSTHHDVAMEQESIRNLIYQAADGIWVVDYLRGSSSEFDELLDYGNFLKLHKDLIIENSNNLSELDKIAIKYCWLGKYHNNWIESLKPEDFPLLGYKKDDLIITKKEVSFIYEF